MIEQKKSVAVPINGFHWIAANPNRLGGQATLIHSRLSVSLILRCLAAGMTAEEIAEEYEGFHPEALPEIFQFAAEQMEKASVYQTYPRQHNRNADK